MTPEITLDGVLSACTPAVLALLAYLSALLTKFFNTKTEEMKTRANDTKLSRYISVLNGIVTNVVVSLNSSMVDELKKANEDGKLTIAEIQEIKNRALDTILEQVSEDMYNALTAVLGDVRLYLSNLIDRRVEEVKVDITKVS